MKKPSGSKTIKVKENVKSGAGLTSKTVQSKVDSETNYPVKYLSPQSSAVTGTVAFNDGDPISVSYPYPADVNPGVPVPSVDEMPYAKVHTVSSQQNGGSATLYLFYEVSGSTRTYYESPNSSGSPRVAIATELVVSNPSFLVFELQSIVRDNKPTIVIGTIVIDLPKD